jgi:hypothetical protein
VAQIEPDGKQAARGLRELVNLKDKAQYGVLAVGPTELTAVMRKALRSSAYAAAQGGENPSLAVLTLRG